MSKNITTSFLTGMQSPVATLAICMELRRGDGSFIRLTNHDEDLVIGGLTYSSEIPFIVSAIDGGSALNADTAEIEVAIDGVIFTSAEVRYDAYKNAEIELFEVDYENTAAGKMTIRKGWIAKSDTNKNAVGKFEINGLLKILDFSVGRIFQPSCDADLGDKRCRVAVDQSQHYSMLNRYEVGDWVYHYPPGSLSTVTLVNGSFGSEGVREQNQAIEGWTRGPSSTWVVSSESDFQTELEAHASTSDIYFLEALPDADPEGEETYVYQDVDLLAASGMSATDIDDGQIVLATFAYYQQTAYLFDKPRVVVDVLDEDFQLVERIDTDYFEADTFGQWRERAVVFSLLPGARHVRLYLYVIRRDADIPNTAYDEVRMGWWNHTIGSPNADVIHKVSRIINTRGGYMDYTLPNRSFELDATVANSDAATISRWTKSAGSFWRTATSVGALPAADGSYLLIGGDDASGVQQTYEISQTFAIVATGLPLDRISGGKTAGRMDVKIAHADTDAEAEVELVFLTGTDVEIGTVTIVPMAPLAAVGYAQRNGGFMIPATARKIRVVLRAKSPVGSSIANVGFDGIDFYFLDGERPDRQDPVFARSLQYQPASLFDQTAGRYTVDNILVWKAHTVHHQYDTVAAAVDRKNFSATLMTGGEGAFETGLIRWISGANAGSKNLIRVWEPGDKGVRLYFPTVFPITAGDRFTYVRPCQKRFLEDCFTRFDNSINFQGFPYLPSTTTG